MRKEKFDLRCLATAIGSMPNTSPEQACDLVLSYLPCIPAWPQLPRRSFRENMYVQFSEGLPGIVTEDGRIWVDTSQDLSGPLEQLYSDYLDGNVERRAISPEYAHGFKAFLEKVKGRSLKGVKGQVTGPVSFGLVVTDPQKKPLLYDEVISDAIAKHLNLKAAWQENMLKTASPNTIISVDEPYLASLGSAFISIPRERVIDLLEEVLNGIRGLRAIHCCGNTDWPVLLQTSADILSFDAYNYGETLGLYPAEVKDFLRRGGTIAWGIVPTDEGTLTRESEAGLVKRLEELMKYLAGKGIGLDTLQSQCLITPSCGLGPLSVGSAEKALLLTSRISAAVREKLCGKPISP